MNYEKKYKEALAKAREQYNYPTMDSCHGLLEELFPELKEPENELIRKTLINMFEHYKIEKVGDFTQQQILDWLKNLKRSEL